jgi:hypothetical protein
MIGVAASPADLEMAREFFELFKTAWEPAVASRSYDVVLSTDGRIADLDARVFLLYGSDEQVTDRQSGMTVTRVDGAIGLAWDQSELPLYGGAAQFDRTTTDPLLTLDGQAADYRSCTGSRAVWRIGYDLFREVRHLLTNGQPVSHAAVPTLEFHIAVLRHVLQQSAVSFVEIPPRPYGFDFTCCLTHDIDFLGLTRHKFDRTLAGFLYRASCGTLVDLARGRKSAVEAARNWAAALSVPFVFTGVLPDPWRPFDSYREVEQGRRSTFFLVPFKHRPGVSPDGDVQPQRGVPYEVSEIRAELSGLARSGSELAVHGIDAWRDADAGRAEIEQLTSVTGHQSPGVRMHWLYYGADSPRQLEAAGFAYDSTWGYNDAIGYRAGTSQSFKLPGTEGLMELPLSIMDSALFYPSRMGLERRDAMQRCLPLIANARRFGGTLVINWHDRSLAPERLWGRSYGELLEAIDATGGAWFATAGEAVSWFQWRRSVRFIGSSSTGITVTAPPPAMLPAAAIQVHRSADGRDASPDVHRFEGGSTRVHL